jgi:hypothetical protein
LRLISATEDLDYANFNITLNPVPTATALSLRVTLYTETYLVLLSVQYLAVDRAFPHHLNIFNHIDANYSNGNLINITSSAGTRTYTNSIVYANLASSISSAHTAFNPTLARNKVVLYLTGFFGRRDGWWANKGIEFNSETLITSPGLFTIIVIIFLNIKGHGFS